MNYQPDEYQAKCLITWYPKDHELYTHPLHPLIKLAGEAGELLDLYGKHLFKPGFDWFNCKHCKEPELNHVEGYCKRILASMEFSYTPLVLDELGDWWYYFRIVTFIYNTPIEQVQGANFSYHDTTRLLTLISLNSSIILNDYQHSRVIDESKFGILWGCFEPLLVQLNYDIDSLTQLNYIKLNSDTTNHGWKNATVKNEATK